MGKVRTSKVKRLAKEVFQNYREMISEDFERNKQIVEEILKGQVSKKLRNRIAGYLTSLVKHAKEKEVTEESVL